MKSKCEKYRWRLLPAALAAIAAAVCCPQAFGQIFGFGQRSVLMQAVRGGWMQFNIVAGRVQVYSSQYVNVNNSSERLSMRPDGNDATVLYESTIGDESLRFEIKGGVNVRLRREVKARGQTTLVEFVQVPGQAIGLEVAHDGKQSHYAGKSVWHLLLAEREVCRQHLLPLLEMLQPDWHLAEKTVSLEEELLRTAASGQSPDRQRWQSLVGQLGDDSFARREAADRELRAAGPAVVAYLQRLDFGRLEAEQQARLRRIIAAVGQSVDDDTVEQVVIGLATEPDVWLTLLDRPEECTRRLAAEQLARVLGRAIEFDPAAPAEVRRSQIGRLRRK